MTEPADKVHGHLIPHSAARPAPSVRSNVAEQKINEGVPDAAGCGLLQVALDLGLAANLRLAGILPELAAGTALAQQVPALVEIPLDVSQAGALLVGQWRPLFAQVVLLRDKFPHAIQDTSVVHCSLPLRRRALGHCPTR